MNGFQNYLKISQGLINSDQAQNQIMNQSNGEGRVLNQNSEDQVAQAVDRAKKEMLAMQILSQQNQIQIAHQNLNNNHQANQQLNLSQIQTIKQSSLPNQQQVQQNQTNQTLVLDSLQASNLQIPSNISMIQTPQSMMLNHSKMSYQTPFQQLTQKDSQITQKFNAQDRDQQSQLEPQQKQQQQQFQNCLNQYQSPYFNSAEDSQALVQFFSNQSQKPNLQKQPLMLQHVNNFQMPQNFQDTNMLTLQNLQLLQQTSSETSKGKNLSNSSQFQEQNLQDQNNAISQAFNQAQLIMQNTAVVMNDNSNISKFQGLQDGKTKRKSKSKKNAELTKKLTKKVYNEEEYSNRKHYQIQNEIQPHIEMQNNQIQDTTQSLQEYEPSLNYVSQLNQSGFNLMEQLLQDQNLKNVDLAQLQHFILGGNFQEMQAQYFGNQIDTQSSMPQSSAASSANTQPYDSSKINTAASAQSQKGQGVNSEEVYQTKENAREFIMKGESQAQYVNEFNNQLQRFQENPYHHYFQQQPLNSEQGDPQQQEESSAIYSEGESQQTRSQQDAQFNAQLGSQQNQQFHQGLIMQQLQNNLHLAMIQSSEEEKEFRQNVQNQQMLGLGDLNTDDYGEEDEDQLINHGIAIQKCQSANKNDQSLIKVLSEMNLSDQFREGQNLKMLQNRDKIQSRDHSAAAEASFLDKSELQFFEQQNQSQSRMKSESQEQSRVQNKAKKVVEKLDFDINGINRFQQVQSLGVSNLNSKNSTFVGNQLNPHFKSQHNLPSDQYDKYSFHIEESERSQLHPRHQIGSVATTNRQDKKHTPAPIHTQGQNLILQHNSSAHHFSQPSNLLSPYGPHGQHTSSNQHQNNYDHFKSQCSEVIIRGSSETDISNRIQAMKRYTQTREGSGGGRQTHHPQSETSNSHHFHSHHNLNGSNHHQHSHQISGSQSIVNLAEPPTLTRSQFTSIDTHATQSPTKIIPKKQTVQSQQAHSLMQQQISLPNIPKANHQLRNPQSPAQTLDPNSQLNFQKHKLNMIHQSEANDQLLADQDEDCDGGYDPHNRYFEERVNEQHLMAGDTFMKDTQKRALEFNSTGQSRKVNNFLKNYKKNGQDKGGVFEMDLSGKQQQQQIMFTASENYQSLETETNHPEIIGSQSNGSAQQQTENDFNYTIRLDELTQQQKSQSNSYAQRPPIYQPSVHHHSLPVQSQINYQSYANHFMNGTSSTAGFPQIYGYQATQQSGRKSSSNSSFHSHNIKHSESQSTLPLQSMQSQRSISTKARIKKLSFMEKVILIQQKAKEFLLRMRLRMQNSQSMQICNTKDLQKMMDQVGDGTAGDEEIKKLVANHELLNLEPHLMGFFGDSTIQKPQDDSLSNMSAQLLNSLKQDLGGSHIRSIKPGDQSYQKNILESLNLTTGNTFIKDTRHFNQGQLRERTQNFGNSSALVLYSGSTHDNRVNPFQRNSALRQSEGNNLESQGSFQKPPLCDQQDFVLQGTANQQNQLSPNNTSSLLNMTEDSSSGVFKLTPLASQNVTQKTGHTHAHYNQTTSNMNATESNNLNYSCSEIESEWCNQVQSSGGGQLVYGGLSAAGVGSVSPLSVNTTSSKIKNLNGTRPGQRIANQKQQMQESMHTGGVQTPQQEFNHIMFQRSGSVQSEQPIIIPHSLIQKQNSKIYIEGAGTHQSYQASDKSQNNQEIIKMHSEQQSQQQERQAKLLSILKSTEDYEKFGAMIAQAKEAEHQSEDIHGNYKEANSQMGQEKQTEKSQIIRPQWKLLQPMRLEEFNQMIKSIFLPQDLTSQQPIQEAERLMEEDTSMSYKRQLVAMELH